jgi:hypothetical protein
VSIYYTKKPPERLPMTPSPTLSDPDSPFINAERAKTIDLDDYVDRMGTVDLDGLTVGVTIKEARVRFGHLDLLVVPREGRGERWVESRRVRLF